MLERKNRDLNVTVWESENRKITYVQGDGTDLQLDGQTATVIIKDIRSWKHNFMIFLSGSLVGAAVGLIMGIAFPI